jgi:hypothetical protein
LGFLIILLIKLDVGMNAIKNLCLVMLLLFSQMSFSMEYQIFFFTVLNILKTNRYDTAGLYNPEFTQTFYRNNHIDSQGFSEDSQDKFINEYLTYQENQKPQKSTQRQSSTDSGISLSFDIEENDQSFLSEPSFNNPIADITQSKNDNVYTSGQYRKPDLTPITIHSLSVNNR